MMLTQILCPICEKDDTRKYIVGGPDDIVQCKQCGLVYVNPRLSEDEISKFFAENYITDTNMFEMEFGQWRIPTLSREAELVKINKNSGKILDIGCAGGEFLSYFPANIWERHGIDPSFNSMEKVNRQGIFFHQGLLSTTFNDFKENSFDVITILDTFFFSPTPNEDLEKVHFLLKTDGILVLELPGHFFRILKNTGLISLLIYRRWCHLSSKSPHLFHYSDASIRKLLKKCNFKIEGTILEQSPVRGSKLFQLANNIYFKFSKFIFSLTFQKVNIAAKVVYLCSKNL
jgi:SAM-dependent methyltransferase